MLIVTYGTFTLFGEEIYSIKVLKHSIKILSRNDLSINCLLVTCNLLVKLDSWLLAVPP